MCNRFNMDKLGIQIKVDKICLYKIRILLKYNKIKLN